MAVGPTASRAEELDRANRLLLAPERERLEEERDRLLASFAVRARRDLYDNRSSDLWYAQRKMEDIAAVEQALAENPDARLVFFDMRHGARGKAAVAVGDIGSADRISVAVPGMNTTPGRSIVDMAREARALRECATTILRNQGSAQTVACVGWIGYETPHAELDPKMMLSARFGPGWGDGATGALRLLSISKAKRGALELAEFLAALGEELPQTRSAAPAEGTRLPPGVPGRPAITVLGHSYGSLTASFALQRLRRGVVGDVVFFGSPGIKAVSAQQLGLEPGHVFAMQASGDLIRRVSGWFSKPVVQTPWIQRLSTRAAIGPGDGLAHEGSHGHADYPRLGENGQVRITGYNMACVLAGHPELAVRGV